MKGVTLGLLGLLLLAARVVVQGQSGSGEGFDYIVNPDDTNSVTLTSYIGTNSAVSVPTTVNNLDVTGIGRTGLVGLDYSPVFGDTVTSVTIPSSVTSIGTKAFFGCGALTNVTIPDSVTLIDNSAFSFCTNLGEIIFPESVTTIGDSAFFNCEGLTNVIIPGSVTIIEGAAFFGCASMTNVSIGNGVVSISQGAFYGCDSLTTVNIPSSVTSIGGAFEGCLGLTEIIADALNPVFSSVNGILFDKRQTALVEYPGGLIGNYAIPANVTNIGEYAFADCSLLTGVTVPKGVSSIGVYGFAGSGVTNIYFLGNAPEVDSSVFSFDVATIYDLPGTTGWGIFTKDTGIPVTLWMPLIEGTQTNLNVRTNVFGFNIFWADNLTVVVEACTNLANPVWEPLQTNTLIGAPLNYSDPQWTNYAARFYRISVP